MKVATATWRVRFNDWMFLQPGGVLLNRAKVTKFEFEIGKVTMFFVTFEEAILGTQDDQSFGELMKLVAAG